MSDRSQPASSIEPPRPDLRVGDGPTGTTAKNPPGGQRLAAPGVWMPGDDPGRRKFAPLFDGRPLRLEGDGSMGPITVAYETWGNPTPSKDNAILVEHALTGDSHAAGSAEPGHATPGWW